MSKYTVNSHNINKLIYKAGVHPDRPPRVKPKNDSHAPPGYYKNHTTIMSRKGHGTTDTVVTSRCWLITQTHKVSPFAMGLPLGSVDGGNSTLRTPQRWTPVNCLLINKQPAHNDLYNKDIVTRFPKMPSSDIQDRDRLMLKDYSQDNWSVGSRDI